MTAYFPLTDFQFVFYGFATFAATVGYAAVKRRSSVHQDPPPSVDRVSSQASDKSESTTSDDNTSTDTEPKSLKRKSVDDHDSSTRPPRKRSRSPSVVIVEEPKPSCITSPSDVEITKADSADSTTKQMPDAPAKKDEPTPPAQDADKPAEIERTAITPPSPPPPPKRATGFAAFAGTGSPFTVSPFSPNGTTTSPNQQRSVWSSNGNVFTDLPQAASSDSNSQAVDCTTVTSSTVIEAPPVEKVAVPNANDIALAAVETRVKTTVAHPTGEEDETVTAELKGVKLFVKRGSRGFTGGMPGHIKLLSRSGSGEERLLFRREPLWKVSMNVRLRPTVRCTFDAEDGVLRIVLKEAIEYGDDTPEKRPQELVVYALKRGRVPKKDFTEFAQALLENPRCKSPIPSEPVTIES